MFRHAAILAAVVSAVLVLSACTAARPNGVSDSAEIQCPEMAPSDCQLELRIAAANDYVASRPGRIGFVVRDRKTGSSTATKLRTKQCGRRRRSNSRWPQTC